MSLNANSASVFLFSMATFGGFWTFLLVWQKRQGARKVDWLESVFVSLVSLIVLFGWAGVFLASFGNFSLAGVALVGLAIILGVWWWQRPFSPPRFLPITRHEWLLLALLGAFAILYARPHEYILGGTDAGTYTNISATLVQTGDFVLRDEWVGMLQRYADVTLRQQPPHWQTRYLQFVGWYIDNRDPTRIIPQFFPFHPVWMAIGNSIGGLMGGWLVTPLWGVLGLAAVYLLTRALFGRTTALLASLLVGLTPTHIYFARYPTTEPLTLLLLFSSLYAFQQFWDDERVDPIWGIFSGATLGAALLTRIDLPVLLILILAALILRRQQRRWSSAYTAYTLMLGVFIIHATASALLINWPYTWNTYSSVFRALMNSTAVRTVIFAGVLLFLLALISWRRVWVNHLNIRQWLRLSYLQAGTAVFIVLLSAFTYFVRPILDPVRFYAYWPSGELVPLTDGQNWLRMGWYLTPLGILLSTSGAAWVVWRKPWFRYGPFLAIGLLTTAQYVYRIFNTAYHIYAMRRYVPVVIPALMIFAAVALVVLAKQHPTRYMRLAGGVLAAILAAGLVYQSRFVLTQRDYEGAADQISALHEVLEPQSLLIFNEPPELNGADQLGVPLRFMYGHDIATIRGEGEAIRPFLDELLTYAEAEKRPLYLLAINSIDPIIRQRLTLQPVVMIPVSTHMLINSFGEYPSTRQPIYFGIEIYRVIQEPLSPSLPITINIGTLDAPYIQTGFYYKEPLPGAVTMRWTGANAILEIPMPEVKAVQISVNAMIYRPEGVPANPVTVILDDQVIGQFTPQASWQTFTFRGVPIPQNGLSSLQFQSIPFNPKTLRLSSDDRDLGFLLDWVKINP